MQARKYFRLVRATFAGDMVSNWNTFQPESYRAQINMALDQIWSQTGQTDGAQYRWNLGEANLLLKFFTSAGIATYGTSYTLDGTVINPARELALVATNGVSGSIDYDHADWAAARLTSGLASVAARSILPSAKTGRK